MSQAMLTATAGLVMVLLSHGLSRYTFGLFASLLAFSQALSFVIDIGLPNWLLREAAADYARPDGGEISETEVKGRVYRRLWHTVYTISAGASLVTVVVTIGALLLGLPVFIALAEGGFLAYVGILAVSTSLETDLRSQRKRRAIVIALGIERAFILCGIALVLVAHMGVLGVAVVDVVGGAARLSYSFTRTLGAAAIERPRPSIESLSVIRKSAPFAANTAAVAFFPRIDGAIVGLVSVIAASYFALGFQITTTAFLLPAIAATTLYPFISRTRSAARDRVIIMTMTIAGIAFAAIGIVVSPAVVPLLFGAKYAQAIGPVQIMWLSVPFFFLTSALTPLLYTAQREAAVAKALWPPAIFGTLLVVVGAELYGAAGAGAGYAVRYAMQACVVGAVAYRTSRGRAVTATARSA